MPDSILQTVLLERGLETSYVNVNTPFNRANNGNRGLVRVRVGVRIIFLTYKTNFLYKFMI